MPDSVECGILKRQLACSDHNNSSFSSDVRKILDKYSLNSPEDLLVSPPEKITWKLNMQKAFSTYWTCKWEEEVAAKTSLKYLQVQKDPTRIPHNIWKSTKPKFHEVQRSEIKARLLTGTYILQTNASKFNQNDVKATCKLCKAEDETLEHFLLRCNSLQETRRDSLQILQRIISPTFRLENSELLVQLLLDCTHDRLKHLILLSDEQRNNVERYSQVICYRLHRTRTLLLTSLSSLST
jgi:hypothetical protein